MRWKCLLGGGLAALLAGAVTADAQDIPQPRTVAPGPPPSGAGSGLVPEPLPGEPTVAPGPAPPRAGPGSEAGSQPVPPDPGPAEASTGLEAESLPAEISENIQAPSGYRIGPTPAIEENFLMDYLGLRGLFGNTGIRSFGWIEGGYTGASTGAGILSVEPRQNRFGNEFLFNQIGLTVQKPLQQDIFNLGFMMRYFAGADAALGRSPRGASAIRPAIHTSARISATSTSRPTCRSSPREGWTSRSAA